MKKYVLDFLRRGCVAAGVGPLVLTVLYLILEKSAVIEALSVREVSIGIFSLTALAFVVGGINFIYQIERLPLMVAIFIHGACLYICYLLTYLVNDWLDFGLIPVAVFTGIFVFGFILIWIVIYRIVKRSTQRVNENLKKKYSQ